jgi:hypothetical protein
MFQHEYWHIHQYTLAIARRLLRHAFIESAKHKIDNHLFYMHITRTHGSAERGREADNIVLQMWGLVDHKHPQLKDDLNSKTVRSFEII